MAVHHAKVGPKINEKINIGQPKKYLVTRKLVINDSCVVVANNKTEAIKKAKDGDFYDADEKLGSWDTGDVEKEFKKFEAQEWGKD